MANNEKKTAAERALKHNREWANTWRGSDRLAQSPAERYNLMPGGPQARIMRKEEAGWFPPGGVAALMPADVADPIVRAKHRVKHPDEIGSNLGLMGGEPYKESVQRPPYVKPSDRELPDTLDTPVQGTVADVPGTASTPSTPSNVPHFGEPFSPTGKVSTRSPEENLKTISALIESRRALTTSARPLTAAPDKTARTRQSGPLGTGYTAREERRRTLREYGMAQRALQNDMRRGRISSKKGKVVAATLMDHYDRKLGGDLQELMQEGVRQEGQLMTAQERSAGALDVAQERERGALELAGAQAGMREPETFSMQVIGENADGTKRYGLVGSRGTMPGILGQDEGGMEKHRQDVLAVRGNPEEFAKRKAWFESQYAGETIE